MQVEMVNQRRTKFDANPSNALLIDYHDYHGVIQEPVSTMERKRARGEEIYNLILMVSHLPIIHIRYHLGYVYIQIIIL